MLPLNLPPQDYLGNKPTPLTQADFLDQTDRLRWLQWGGLAESLNLPYILFVSGFLVLALEAMS